MKFPIFDSETHLQTGEYEIPDDVVDAACKVHKWIMTTQSFPERCRIMGLQLVGADTMEVFRQSRLAIEDYDHREARGEDVSNEIRPRMPGGSDF